MSSSSSILPYFSIAVLCAIGALIAWTIYGTGRQLRDLDSLPSCDATTLSTKCVLEGRISSDENFAVRKGGLVAFLTEQRTRSHAPTGKPSATLATWHTKNTTAPPIPVMVGDEKIIVGDYSFPRHVKNWQHALHNTDGTNWTTANTRLRGLLKGMPVVAIGTLHKRGDGTLHFKADVLTAGTRANYRNALETTQKSTGTWVVYGFVAASALFVALALWSMI